MSVFCLQRVSWFEGGSFCSYVDGDKFLKCPTAFTEPRKPDESTHLCMYAWVCEAAVALFSEQQPLQPLHTNGVIDWRYRAGHTTSVSLHLCSWWNFQRFVVKNCFLRFVGSLCLVVPSRRRNFTNICTLFPDHVVIIQPSLDSGS